MSKKHAQLIQLVRLAQIVKQRHLAMYAERIAEVQGTQRVINELDESLAASASRLTELNSLDPAAVAGADIRWEAFTERKRAQLFEAMIFQQAECDLEKETARRSTGRYDVLCKLAKDAENR